ncbi:MAG: alpha/beta hydrolase [Thermoanaerobaculia bacterium]
MTRRRSVLLISLIVIFFAGGCALMFDSFARQMLYPAPPVPVPSPPPPPLEEVWLDAKTGDRILGWTSARPAPEGAPVVLFFHGNGENLETLRYAGLLEDLEALGVAFLAVDYPGYGRSSGDPSEEGLLATGEAAVAWARERHPGRPVVSCGWSLGAAVAIAMAARHPEEVAGLIALSPWTTLEEAARLIFPGFAVKALLRERYDSLAAARRIHVPALVIHGELDEMIPASHGKQIAEALATGRWVSVPRTGHNDLMGQPVVWEEIRRFLAGL